MKDYLTPDKFGYIEITREIKLILEDGKILLLDI